MSLQLRLLRWIAVCLPMLALPGNAARAEEVAKLFSAHARGSAATVDHAAWSGLLRRYTVLDGKGLRRVRYAAWKAEGRAALDAYIASLESVAVARLDRAEQFAFWANLYNAKTIAIVLDKYPVKSIKDISLGGSFLATFTGGPWKAKVVKVSGHDLSLDDIEHGILRPIFKDPRVHYAVNCASVGCPNIGGEAFTGAKLETQLDAAAKAYVNSPRGVSLARGGVTASSIYTWFQADFGGDAAGVLAHLQRYAEPGLRAKLAPVTTIDGYVYDWTLNDAGN